MGTHGTFTSWIFNTSLVFAGLMILVWLPYFMNDLRELERHGLTDANKIKWMRNGLIAWASPLVLWAFSKTGSANSPTISTTSLRR